MLVVNQVRLLGLKLVSGLRKSILENPLSWEPPKYSLLRVDLTEW